MNLFSGRRVMPSEYIGKDSSSALPVAWVHSRLPLHFIGVHMLDAATVNLYEQKT